MNKKIVLILLFLGLVLATSFLVKHSRKPNSSTGVSQTTTSPTPTPTATPKVVSSDQNGVAQLDTIYGKLTKPATCQVGGQIKFVSHNTSEHINSDLIYTGIDSPARLIKWQVTPGDDLKVGPNLAASIALPDGKEMINVVLPEKTKAPEYKLIASMTYGRLVNNDVKVYEVQCKGQTDVLLNF